MTEKAYLIAIKRFEEIFNAESGSTESDEAEILSLQIRDYEEKHYAIDLPKQSTMKTKVWNKIVISTEEQNVEVYPTENYDGIIIKTRMRNLFKEEKHS
jgi:hypothetical protein